VLLVRRGDAKRRGDSGFHIIKELVGTTKAPGRKKKEKERKGGRKETAITL